LNRSVFINATGVFLPNAPVDNDSIERVLGQVHGKPSRARNIVLQSNQIKTRHYAIDPLTRAPTHTNAQLAAEAVNAMLREHPSLSLRDAQLLACGTSSPDLIIPGHAAMVQGHLPQLHGEAVSTAGVCCSSMAALKFAWLSILAADANAAVVTGSETASKWMRSEFFESEDPQRVAELATNPAVAFEHDFLRWMLSDGAGAVWLSHSAAPDTVNLRINWIEGRSYANEQPVCMFAGGQRQDDGTVTPWKDLRLSSDPGKLRHVMNASQDIRILRDQMPICSIEHALREIADKRRLDPDDYAWFLPHYSSHYFREVVFDSMTRTGFQIPYDRWFTRLYQHGNVGSASMFIFIDRLLRQVPLRPGEKILCYIPESGRFSVYYMELEVV
jgi:3-oxoacyl-[acyl-carrier-protein] synthase-3